MSRWSWLWSRVSRRLWFRATMIGLMGIAAAGFATVADRFLPSNWTFEIGSDSIESILTIIASSMLAVTTFSLSTLTSALGGATSNVTPRANRLLMQDRVTQNVLSTFVGSFLFSIVGLVVLQTNAYGDQGRAVLFIVTVGVLVLIVISLLRWIDRLIQLGRVEETTQRVEEAARRAIETRIAEPYLGGHPRPAGAVPSGSPHAICAEETGYIVHIDMGALEEIAASRKARVDIAQLPGAFLYQGRPLAWISQGAALEPEDEDRLRSAFQLTQSRDYDQDPRFGIIVLSEIASRALSPAVNDPGTAIDVIGRITRLLTVWAKGFEQQDPQRVTYPHLHVPPLEARDLFADGFAPIGRDGASLIEVQMRLQKALIALSELGGHGFRTAALHQSRLALAHAEKALALEVEKEDLRNLLAAPFGPSAGGARQ
ncbi:DUF2254 domain-containing protein [Paracoccus sp. (in: a-proteobacteria)]|uniref:DUF2254 domain-containing protein n=1 Tax=Paracoccus sp. TaxID=267 RepID=UPI00396CC82C